LTLIDLIGVMGLKKVLSIAGSDSCGGAGIQADIKAMSALGVYGMSVICAVTAQNTTAVTAVQEISPDVVQAQIDAIFSDIEVDAVKIGMVSNAEIIRIIKDSLLKYKVRNVVVDPVMVSKSGYHLLREEAVEELKKLIAIADLVTPNIPEAEVLTGMMISSEEAMGNAARRIGKYGARNVLIKGGHRCNDASDVLLFDDRLLTIAGERIETNNTHGTGCTLSSAIASFLAKGFSVEMAVKNAKAYITECIKNSFEIGRGVGPVGHFVELYKRSGIQFD
jgi:hydroxymethylpyrimidine/phosphomethylpyrimidine kinase